MYSVDIDVYVTEDSYIAEVESDEELAELEARYVEVERFSAIVPEDMIEKIVSDKLKTMRPCDLPYELRRAVELEYERNNYPEISY